MKRYNRLVKAVKDAQSILNSAKEELREYNDGFLYLVCVMSYGTQSWSSFTNPFMVKELIDEYYDGYNGLLKIYTNNPKWKMPKDEGCVTEFKVMSLDEMQKIAKDTISMSEAICNWISLSKR